MARKIVVAEELAPAGMDALGVEFEVVDAAGKSRPELLELLSDASALVVRSATTVDAELMAAAPMLEVVGRAGVGVDNIDLEAATASGVMVVNAPQANIISAAEHAFALLMAQARNLGQAQVSMQAGRWDRKLLKGVELYEKTLGVVGFGRIGRLVAERAAAFGMTVLAYDPFVGADAATRLGVEIVDLDELYARSDFITIHLPKTPETTNLISADSISKMKDGVRIVNASRGGIVHESDLIAALESGKVASAGLDVFEVEPLAADSPLRTTRNLTLTPHLGASTVEAQDKAGLQVAEAVTAALSGALVASAVNVSFGPPAPPEITAYLPVAENLGQLFASLAQGLPSEVHLKIGGELAQLATQPLVLAFLKGALQGVTTENVTYVNVQRIADHRGVRVVTEASGEAREFKSLISATGVLGERAPSVSGTVTRKGPTLVGIDEMEIELPFGENLLLIRHTDKPGLIGAVGMMLGEFAINIDNMVVGPTTTGQPSLMGLVLAESLSSEQVDRILSVPGVDRVRFITF